MLLLGGVSRRSMLYVFFFYDDEMVKVTLRMTRTSSRNV